MGVRTEGVWVIVKGIDEVGRFLSDVQKKQIPFATSLAINKTARSIKAKIEDDIKRVFDNPTPFIKRSLRIKVSTKRKLFAVVQAKDRAEDILLHHIEGGKRRFKRSEMLLHRRGILPRGRYTILARGAPKNKYGNMTGGQYTKMLSQLRTLRETGYSGNLVKGKRAVYFSTRFGVYKRTGKRTLKQILYFTQKTPKYKKRLPFDKTVTDIYNKEYELHFDRAFAFAVRTA